QTVTAHCDGARNRLVIALRERWHEERSRRLESDRGVCIQHTACRVGYFDVRGTLPAIAADVGDVQLRQEARVAIVRWIELDVVLLIVAVAEDEYELIDALALLIAAERLALLAGPVFRQ